MPTPYIKDGSVQKRVTGIYIKQSDVQVRIVRAYQKIAGVQTLLYLTGYDLVISADTTLYNIRAQLLLAGWNGVDPVSWNLTNNSGIFVRATTTSNYAIDTGAALPVGSGPFTFTNLGKVQGKGGLAGNGGTTVGDAGTAGLVGGAAMRIQYPISIANASGYILGGGDGGHGGAGARTGSGNKSSPFVFFTGGGGGGGAGTGAPGTGANSGTAGTNVLTAAANGVGGAGASPAVAGANGGDWGVNGKAISTGGNTVTWLSGNDGTHVKGAVS